LFISKAVKVVREEENVMRTLATLVLLAALSDSAWSQTVIDGSDADLPKAETKAAIDVIGTHLRDPASAQIKRLKVSDAGIFCGLVNAKTLAGGYAGFRHFVYQASPRFLAFQANRNDGQFETAALILPPPQPGKGCIPD
jgi:hypothetical protein